MIANKLRYKQVDSSSGFDPNTVANKLFWLQQGVGMLDGSGNPVTANGTTVATWQDQTGNGNHFTGAGTYLDATGAGNGNGQGAMYSDGSSSGFSKSSLSMTSDYSFFVVQKVTNQPNLFSHYLPYGGYSMVSASGSSTAADNVVATPTYRINGISASVPTRDSLYTQTNNKFLLISQTGTSSILNNNSQILLWQYAGLRPVGQYCEIFWVNRAVSNTERADIENYFIAKYSNINQYLTSLSLLLHMDGTNGSTTFADSSPNALTVTANGGAQISTAQTKSGFSEAGYFNGTNSFVSTPDSTALEFGSGDFTVEAWIYPTSNTGMRTIFSKTSNGYSPLLFTVNNGNLVYYMSSTGTGWNVASGVSAGSVTLNAWNHIAISRSGTSVKPFVNGVAGTSTTTSASLVDNTGPVRIGANYFTGTLEYFAGYMDEVRVTKMARYVSNYTPPASPFPNS